MTAIEKLTALIDAATKEPWSWKPCEVEIEPYPDGEVTPVTPAWLSVYTVDCGDVMGLNDADAELIVAARSALPAMIAFVKATAERFCRECGGSGEIRVEIGNLPAQRPCRRCGTTGYDPLSSDQQAAMQKLKEVTC